MTSEFRRRASAAIAALLGLVVVVACSACSASTGHTSTEKKEHIVRVPQDAKTISRAMTEVAPGGLVLVSPGTYHESVSVTVPDVTIRGTDRNAVIIDGEGTRPNGIVVSSDGVTVQNLTVTAHTFYGVLITGMPNGGTGHTGSGYEKLDPDKFPPVQRFRVDHVTAINNGLYGIYAFDSQHGVIENSYASGSADSGFYVGQCEKCDITVRGNVAERNAVGFENANASDSVYVVGNRWAGNRVGMTLITSYQEAFVPQKANTVVGNLIADNTAKDSPAQAEGGFGIGIGISGGQGNAIHDNRISGNPRVGIALNNAEDIPAKGNRMSDNAFGENGVDIADTSTAATPSSNNCIGGDAKLTVVPQMLAKAVCPTGSPTSAGASPDALPRIAAPPGVVFLDVAPPRHQPNLTGNLERPGPRLPKEVGKPDLSRYPVPETTLLAEFAGTA